MSKKLPFFSAILGSKCENDHFLQERNLLQFTRLESTTLTTKNFSLWNLTQVHLRVYNFVVTTMGINFHCFELTGKIITK